MQSGPPSGGRSSDCLLPPLTPHETRRVCWSPSVVVSLLLATCTIGAIAKAPDAHSSRWLTAAVRSHPTATHRLPRRPSHLGVSAPAVGSLLLEGLAQFPAHGSYLPFANAALGAESLWLLAAVTPFVFFLLSSDGGRGPALAAGSTTAAPHSPDTTISPLYFAVEDRISPFQSPTAVAPADPPAATEGDDPPDVLTEANVERVLNELRPYLVADGGNVELVEIDGPVVYLRLQGACGSCASSAVTMAMGIKRRLMEVIPEIQAVEEVVTQKAAGLPLTAENVEHVLGAIRPYFTGAGGGDAVLRGISGMTVQISLQGPVKDIMTIRVAVVQKLRDSIPTIQAVQLV